MNYYDDFIIPKYRKRKNKTVRKSDHKHEYEIVLIVYNYMDRDFYHKGEKCIICGKINNERMFEGIEIEGTNYTRMLTQEEVLEKYKDKEIVRRKWGKYGR